MQSPSLFDILRNLGVDKDTPEFLRLATVIVRYIIGADSAYECQHGLKESFDFKTVDTSAQKFRLYLSDMSYVQMNLKFFCLHLIKHKMNREKLRQGVDDFEVHRNDVVLLRRILEQRGFRSEMRKNERIAPIEKQQVTLEAYKSVFTTFDRIYPSLVKHIKSRVYTKLRFISVSSNMEFYDLQMELMCKALQTFIKIVPTDKTELYITNYIRSAISNHTTNMIKSYTTQKRKRMVQGAADGFGGFTYEIPVLSENQLLKTFGVENLSYESMQGAEESSETDKHREDQLNYESLLRKFGRTNKRRMFIKLMAGQECHFFSRYLARNRLIAHGRDNVDFNEAVDSDAYLDAVCRYLNIRKWKAKRFLNYIAKEAYPEFTTEK